MQKGGLICMPTVHTLELLSLCSVQFDQEFFSLLDNSLLLYLYEITEHNSSLVYLS